MLFISYVNLERFIFLYYHRHMFWITGSFLFKYLLQSFENTYINPYIFVYYANLFQYTFINYSEL